MCNPATGRKSPASDDPTRLKMRAVRKELAVKQFDKTEKKLTDELTVFFQAQLKSIQRNMRTATGTNPDRIMSQCYDPRDWDRPLYKVVVPIMAQSMVEGAAAELVMLGYDPRRLKKSARTGRKATGTFELLGVDIPEGIGKMLPDWMVDQILSELSESMSQPHWKGINDTTADRVEGILIEGLSSGQSVRDIADNLMESMPETYSRSRATNVARTESGNALNAGRDMAYQRLKDELPPEASKFINKEWLSILSATTRATHADADGQLADEDGMFEVGGYSVPWPGHYDLPPEERCNCFPSGTLVSGTFCGAQAAWYEGSITEIVTGSGGRVSLTPNHPVMTADGWVPAGKIEPGMKILAYRVQAESSVLSAASGDEVQDKPVPIEQVAELYFSGSVPGSLGTEVRRGQSDDFYGDGSGIKGNVYVVRPNRELLGIGESEFSDMVSEHLLITPDDGRLSDESSHGTQRLLFVAPDPAANCGPSLGESGLDILRGLSLTPSGDLPIGVAADWDAVFLESPHQHRPTVASLLGELCQRSSGQISIDDLAEVLDIDLLWSDADSIPSEVSGKSVGRDGVLGCQALERGLLVGNVLGSDCAVVGSGDRLVSGFEPEFCQSGVEDVIADSMPTEKLLNRAGKSVVFLDDVIEVNRNDFAGHVYDLQSRCGYVAACSPDNPYTYLIFSNCQCTTETAFGAGAPEDEIEQILSEGELTGDSIDDLVPDELTPIGVDAPPEDAAPQVEPWNGTADDILRFIAEDQEIERVASKFIEEHAETLIDMEKRQQSIDAKMAEFSSLKKQEEKLRNEAYFENDIDKKGSLIKQRTAVSEAIKQLTDDVAADRKSMEIVVAESRKSLYEPIKDRAATKVKVRTRDPNIKERAKEAIDFINSVSVKSMQASEFDLYMTHALRAYYDDKDAAVMVNKYAPVATHVHEMAHHLEFKAGGKGLAKASESFIDARVKKAGTKDVSLRSMFPDWGFDRGEKGNEDSFGKVYQDYEKDAAVYAHYTGKKYKDFMGKTEATELISMGVERLYRNPVTFAKQDPEYFKFILGVMKGKFVE